MEFLEVSTNNLPHSDLSCCLSNQLHLKQQFGCFDFKIVVSTKWLLTSKRDEPICTRTCIEGCLGVAS